MSDPQHPDEQLKVAHDQRKLISDQLQGFSVIRDAESRQEVSDVLHTDPQSKHALGLSDLMLAGDKCQISYEQLQGFSDPPSLHLNEEHGSSILLGPPSDPLQEEIMLADLVVEENSLVKKHPAEEVKVVDDECQQTVSDLNLDEQMIYDQLHGLFEPSIIGNADVLHNDLASKHIHEEHIIVEDECAVAFDDVHVFSDSSKTSLQPLDDEEVLEISDSPTMHLDEILMPADDKRHIFSEQPQGFSYPPSIYFDEELALDSNQLHDFSYLLEPEEIMLVDPVGGQSSRPNKVEEKQNITCGSSGQVVLQNVEHEDIKSLKEKMDIDKHKAVSDNLQALSDPSESSLRSVEELVCIDAGPNNFKVLNAEEVDIAPGAEEADNVEYYTFSLTNHRFSVIISPSHISNKYSLTLPRIMFEELPRERVPVVLTAYGKTWTMFYNGHQRNKTFECSRWRIFAADNKLKVGDACFFELLENSPKKIVFKVVILRTRSSPSHVEAADGNSSDKPIVIE